MTLLRRIARVVIPLVGADIGVRLAGRTQRRIGPAVAALRVVPGSPRAGTQVNVPPLGSARLDTHDGLLRVDATLVGVEVDDVKKAIAKPSDIKVDADLKAALIDLGSRAVAGSAAGGAVAALISRRTAGSTAIGAALGAGMFAANAAVAAATARMDAWRSPELSGLLTRAPQMIGDVQQIPQNFDRYRKQIEEITASVTGVYNRLTHLPGAPANDSIAVVFVADIHNNPVAFDVVKGLVTSYDAALVIDAGDIADWGTAQEAKTFEAIGDIPVPYVFIKGNHDSGETVKQIGKHDNVVVLTGGEPTEVAGLRLVGDADPRFTPDKATGDDDFSKERLAELGRELAGRVRTADADIAVVHDPAMARELAGAVPAVLSGHTHRRRYERSGDTLLLTQGSSGGVGLRGVRTDPPLPLEVSVLLLDPATKRLRTIDDITVGGLGQTEVTMVRRSADDIEAAT